MTATPDPTPEPLAALPLLTEAGVSVYWVPLDGRTAWVADAHTRQVWISRAVPREALLRSLIEALEVIDASGPGLRLVSSTDHVEPEAHGRAPALRVVGD
ncbi:hypothetical protein ACFPK1_06035 [Actinomycetospora rhizophila]|uniref:Uncharacterized protein n=1 Tax=Actinomycetospora rhizophila TaxID=1416876 RepID=A0ABV9Z9S3_9PSEU